MYKLFNKSKDKQEFEINGWNDQQEGLLKNYGEQVIILEWIHNQSQIYYTNLWSYINLPIIILSAIAGFLQLLVRDFIMNVNVLRIINLIIGLIMLIVTILSSIQQIYKFQTRAENHKSISIKCGLFTNNIREQLTRPRSKRKEGISYIHRSKIEYNYLIHEPLDLNHHILKKFNTVFKETNIPKPAILGYFDKIKVTRSEESDFDEKIALNIEDSDPE
jgi:hypothetical protein